MTESKFPKYLKALARNKERARGSGQEGQESAGDQEVESVLEPCCQGRVHIIYRGVSDERLYMSRDRAFGEIKFYRPYGLKIFCAGCRRRLV